MIKKEIKMIKSSQHAKGRQARKGTQARAVDYLIMIAVAVYRALACYGCCILFLFKNIFLSLGIILKLMSVAASLTFQLGDSSPANLTTVEWLKKPLRATGLPLVFTFDSVYFWCQGATKNNPMCFYGVSTYLRVRHV